MESHYFVIFALNSLQFKMSLCPSIFPLFVGRIKASQRYKYRNILLSELMLMRSYFQRDAKQSERTLIAKIGIGFIFMFFHFTFYLASLPKL